MEIFRTKIKGKVNTTISYSKIPLYGTLLSGKTNNKLARSGVPYICILVFTGGIYFSKNVSNACFVQK